MRLLVAILAVCVLITAAGSCMAAGLDALKDFTGIQYTEQGSAVGMPMGGIGAGCVEITSKGTLAEFAHLNNWVDRIPSIAGTGLFLTYREGATTRIFPLAGQKVNFEANYPFAKLTFTELPVKLTLWCWSPFILHDARSSAYPGAIFDAEIVNTGSAKAQVGLALSYGTDYGTWTKVLAPAEMKDIPIRIESAASPFNGRFVSGMGVNIVPKAHETALNGIQLQTKKTLEEAYLRSYTYTTIDMKSACNRSYLKNPFNDVDPKLCFTDLKPGRLTLYNVPFDLLGDDENADRTCVIPGPEEGEKSINVPIYRQADCLYFLGNCAAWGVAGTATYVVHYTDGSSTIVPLRMDVELCDWMGGAASSSPAKVSGPNGLDTGTYRVNLFAVPTDGTKTISSVDVKKTGKTAPVLLAVTVGKLSESPMTAEMQNERRADVDRMSRGIEGINLYRSANADISLAARNQKGATVTTYTATSPDGLLASLSGQQTTPELAAPIYAVEQKITLAPGKTGTIGLLFTWYAPNHYNSNGYRFGHKYEEWFKNSGDVAESLGKDHDKLLAKTKHDFDIIATSTLPKWYREMVQSNFYLMPSTTWWTKDGITFTYETPNGCPLFGTMDVSYYGSFTALAAFPELYAQVLRQYCLVQSVDGYIPHNLGGTAGVADTFNQPKPETPIAPKADTKAYAGYRADTNVKFCLEIYRQYQWTGDKSFVKEVWPNLKRAMAWVDNLDEDRDGLPEVNYGYDSWQMVDKVEYISNEWIICLKAVAVLADMMGEPKYAAECRETHKKALVAFEKWFWNGKYFRQGVAGEKSNDEMISSLQASGTWYSTMLGLDDGISREQIRSGLKIIEAVNGKDAIYGISVVIHPDGKRSDSWQQFICDTGWALFFASHCMYEGLDDIGLNISNEIWQKYTVEKVRLPYCQPNVIQQPWNKDSDWWLTRDMRQGVTMTLAYAAAGLVMDIPAQRLSIKPANWVWKDNTFVLPATMPKWLGQIKYARSADNEKYVITNESNALRLKSLRLRTTAKGRVNLTVNGERREATVDSEGMVDAGRVNLVNEVAVSISVR